MNLCREAAGNNGGKEAARAINFYGDTASDAIIKCGERSPQDAYAAVGVILTYGEAAAKLLAVYGALALDCVYSNDDEAAKAASNSITTQAALDEILKAVSQRTDLTLEQITNRQDLITSNADVAKAA